MMTSFDLRVSELAKLRDLLHRATAGDADYSASAEIDLALSLLSQQNDLRDCLGRLIADALRD